MNLNDPHEVLATSFADKKDLADFRESGRLSHGDNGIGCWGDHTAQDVSPMCALPPEDIVARWGSMHARDARGRAVLVMANGHEVVCALADRMLPKAEITNGAGIDLNPAAARKLDLVPPFKVPASWRWL